MRIAAIIFIVAAVVLNFLYDHNLILLLAILSYPVLLWVLLRKRRPTPKANTPATQRPHHRDDRFDDLQKIPMDKP